MGGDGQGVEGVRITRKWRDGSGGKHALLGVHERRRSMASPIPIRHLGRVRRRAEKQRRRRVRTTVPFSLLSREGGSPVWIPAFAGGQTDFGSQGIHPAVPRSPGTANKRGTKLCASGCRKKRGMTDCALTGSDLTILPRQGEVSPKVTEGEDTEQPLLVPPPPSGKCRPPPPGGGGSLARLSAALRPPACADASAAHRSQPETHSAPSHDRHHGSR